MHKITSGSSWKVIFSTAVCAALISGCGDGSSTVNDSPAASTDISTDAGALIAYIERLTGTEGNTDGVDVNSVTLVQDDRSEPTALKL